MAPSFPAAQPCGQCACVCPKWRSCSYGRRLLVNLWKETICKLGCYYLHFNYNIKKVATITRANMYHGNTRNGTVWLSHCRLDCRAKKRKHRSPCRPLTRVNRTTKAAGLEKRSFERALLRSTLVQLRSSSTRSILTHAVYTFSAQIRATPTRCDTI